MAQVAVFLRDDELVVVPQGGRGGRYFDIEPVRVVAPEAEAATGAIRASLADSAACVLERPPGPGPYRSPALRAVKARSNKAFMRNAAFCWVFEADGALQLERWQPAADGRGFEPTGDEPAPLPDRDAVGAAVVEVLRTAPRHP